MSDTIKHRHQTAIAPTGADVDNNEWNDSHVFAGGTDGQVVTRNSGAADGWAWTTPALGTIAGYPVLLEEHTAAASAAVPFTTRNKNTSIGGTGATFQSDYDIYIVELINVCIATNDANLLLNVSTDGGATWDTSAVYGRGFQYGATNAATGGGGEVSQTKWTVGGNQTNASTNGICAEFKLFQPSNTTFYKQGVGAGNWGHTSVDWLMIAFGLVWKNTAAYNAMRFTMSSGNITSGIFRVSGVTK